MNSGLTSEFRLTIDDLGMFPEVEACALAAAGKGITLHCSWVTNYFPPSAAYLAEKNVRSGLHLNLLEGPSALKSPVLTDKNGNFNRRWLDFVLPSRRMRTDVEAEIDIQLKQIKRWFGSVAHVDSHLHLHSIPWIYKLVAAKQSEYGFAHLRNPYQPVFDRVIASPAMAKVALLWLFHLGTRGKAMPCYGVTDVFTMDPARCARVLRSGPRELIWHPALETSSIDYEKYRFVDATQMKLRKSESENLIQFLETC